MKHILAAAMLLAAGHTYAQLPVLYDCIYSYQITPKDADKDEIEKTDCILRIGEERSKFIDYSTFRLDSINAIPDASKEMKEPYQTAWQKNDQYFEQTVLTDLTADDITVYCDLSPDRFRYTQPLPLIDWQLSDISETETVCGYTCHKATGEYGGREWIVWYADEIPVPFGPWKLSGLPGLVLKAIDSEGLHDFEAISFRTAESTVDSSDALSEPKIPNVNSIKADKFIERKNSYDRDPIGSVPRESISVMSVLPNRSLIINGVRMRQHKKGYEPLEYSPSELKKRQK